LRVGSMHSTSRSSRIRRWWRRRSSSTITCCNLMTSGRQARHCSSRSSMATCSAAMTSSFSALDVIARNLWRPIPCSWEMTTIADHAGTSTDRNNRPAYALSCVCVCVCVCVCLFL